MRILITTGLYPPQIGGPATYTKLLEEELKRQGYEVSVLPFSSVLKYPPVVRHIVYFFKIFSQSKRKDIIYAQDTVSVGLPSALYAAIFGVRFFVRVPGDFAWEQGTQRFDVKDSIDDFQNKKYGLRVEVLRSLQRFVVQKAEGVVVPSSYFKKVVSGWVSNPEKVSHIYNGISFDNNIDPYIFNKKTIVASGRLVPWKGFDNLIRFIKNTEYDLVILGEGEDRQRLEKIIEEENLGSRVSLPGKVPRDVLMSYNKAAYAVVAPSAFESFSFQIVEAMSVGAVCVAFDIGNLDEIITNGVSGFLVPLNDFTAISAVLDSLDLSREDISRNAIQESKKFSIEKTANSLVDLFKQKEKILFISTDRGLFDENSAVSKRFEKYAEFFENVEIIVFTKKGFQKRISGNIKIYPTNSFSKALYIFDACMIMLTKRFDIISTQDPFETGFLGFLGSFFARWNVQMHTDWKSSAFIKSSIMNRVRVIFASLVLRRVSSIRVVSRRIEKSLPDFCARKKVTVLPVDSAMTPSKNEITEKKQYIALTVSRLEKEKRVDMLIRSIVSVPNITLHVVGSGSESESLKKLTQDLKVSDRVIFEGFQHNVSDFYKKADIYLQASLYEGFGMALFEAGLHGLPIITTDVGLVGYEFSQDSVLVARSVADFSQALTEVIGDTSLRRKLSDRVFSDAVDLNKNFESYYKKYFETF